MRTCPLNGCANEQFTSQSCNKNSFRFGPAGKQLIDPAIAYEVKTFGKNWGILYADYALGQSTRDSLDAALQKAGGTLALKIPVPLNEPNMTTYVSKIPTDGFISALNVTETGSDLARAMAVLQQFGIPKKIPVLTALGKEQFGGVYPDAMNGAIINGALPSSPQPGNQAEADFFKAFSAMAKTDSSVAGALGGPDKALPGNNGYTAFITMNSLKLAMRRSGFTGRADTDKLITALENINEPQGPDYPSGPMIMNKADHQGRDTQYLMKVNGQTEDIVQTFPADTLPMIGTCQVK